MPRVSAAAFIVIIALILVVAVVALALLAVVIAGIRSEERHNSLSGPPHSPSAAVARRLLGYRPTPRTPADRPRISSGR